MREDEDAQLKNATRKWSLLGAVLQNTTRVSLSAFLDLRHGALLPSACLLHSTA